MPPAGEGLGLRHLLHIIFWATLLAAGAGAAQARQVTVKVRYLSAEHVYLDSGALDGLKVGMTGEVRRGDQTVAVLEVLFAADHSAACKSVGESAVVAEGDEVYFTVEDEARTAPSDTVSVSRPSRQRQVPGAGTDLVPEAERAHLTGNIGLVWDHTESTAQAELKTDYWMLPFRFQVENLGKDWELRTRGTLRRFDRSGYSGSTPDGEWRNRVREMSLVKDGDGAPWHLAVGRVRSRQTSAAGPFDGLLVERRLSGETYWGLFGGFTPEWGTYAFGTDDHVKGLTFHSRSRTDSGKFADATVTALGRYRSGEISREYMTWTLSLRDGAKWNLMQGGEVDLNRDWRKDAADGKSLTLTGFALSGGMKVSDRARLDLGFDNRELIRTWESRSLPDSLFRDSGRRGWRAGLSMRTGASGRLRLSGSVRQDDSRDGNTTSWMGRFTQPRLAGTPVGLHLVVRGFDGPYLKGWAPQGGLSLYRKGNRFSLDGGGYAYEDAAGTDTRNNTWASLRWSRDFSRSWSGSVEYRKDWGDDIVGKRWFLEIHHRI